MPLRERLELRLVGDRDLVDATFDQEARGGKPRWTVSARDRMMAEGAVERLEVSGRRCYMAGPANAVRGEVVVAISVSVAFGGAVTNVDIESPPGPPRDCLAAAARAESFPDPGPRRRFQLSAYLVIRRSP